MYRSILLLLSFTFCAEGFLTAQEQESHSTIQPNWEQDLQRRHDELVKTNGSGTDATLRAQLLAMIIKDQDARGFKGGAPKDKEKLVMASNLDEIDATLTAQLKEIVAAHGWPTIALVGLNASNGALLMLTHSHDHEWQLSLLPLLEKLANASKIDGSALATVIDVELISEGKPQRYGERFKFVDGKMEMYAVEDPAGLDARRARMFLPPIDAYKQALSEMYHLQLTDQIAMPEAKQP
jgi:hypothetical protein